LIGYFDLDPNRVFDTILETYEQQPENSVFLELLPNFTYQNTTYLLGFKLEWHQKPNTPNTPPHLLLVAASILKAGYTTMDELYVYLGPPDEELVAAGKAAAAALVSKPGSLPTQEEVAAPGVSYSGRKPAQPPAALSPSPVQLGQLTTARRLHDAAEAMPEHNQKLMLLQGLLEVSHWEGVHQLAERLELLGLQPAADQGVASALCAAVDRLVAPEYAKLNAFVPLAERSAPGAKVGGNHPGSGAPQLPAEAFRLLCLLGPYLHTNLPLFFRVVRVLRAQVSAAPKGDKACLAEVAEVAAGCLLPAQEFIPANPALSEGIWDVLSGLPCATRFRVYEVVHTAHQEQALLSGAHAEVRDMAVRVIADSCPKTVPTDRARKEKEEAKRFARTVAKFSYATPLAAAEAILGYVESNPAAAAALPLQPAAPVVEHTLRSVFFMTRLGLDVVSWCLLHRLSCPSSAPLRPDGRAAPWVSALCHLAGNLCKRFSAVELQPYLHVSLQAMRNAPAAKAEGGDLPPPPPCHELLVLQRLMECLAETPPQHGLTLAEVSSEASGPLLRKQVPFRQTYTNPRNLRSMQRVSARLLDTMQAKVDGGSRLLAGALLLEMGSAIGRLQRNGQPAGGKPRTGVEHCRAVQGALDRCRGTLFQLCRFLRDALSQEAFAGILPTQAEMASAGIPPEVLFHLWRPVLAKQVIKEDSDEEEEGMMLLGEEPSSVPEQQKKMSEDTVKELVPPGGWESVSEPFMATFWSLCLSDIHGAEKGYKSAVASLEEATWALQGARGSSSEVAAKRHEAEKLKELTKNLPVEMEEQKQHVRRCSRRLQLVKDSLLSSVKDHKSTTITFLQSCIFPRCLMGPSDAVYCWRFVDKLNRMKTPYFNMVLWLDQCFKNATAVLQCCTLQEASSLGMFLADMLGALDKWQRNEKVYSSDCGKSPCFIPALNSLDGEPISHEKFKKLCWKWHSMLAKGLREMCKSRIASLKENALLVLMQLYKIPFPSYRAHFNSVKTAVSSLRDRAKDSLQSPLAEELTASLVIEYGKVDEGALLADPKQVATVARGIAGGAPMSSARPPTGRGAGRDDYQGGGTRSRETSPLGRRDAPRERGGAGGGRRGATPPGFPTGGATPPPTTPERRPAYDGPSRTRDDDGASPVRGNASPIRSAFPPGLAPLSRRGPSTLRPPADKEADLAGEGGGHKRGRDPPPELGGHSGGGGGKRVKNEGAPDIPSAPAEEEEGAGGARGGRSRGEKRKGGRQEGPAEGYAEKYINKDSRGPAADQAEGGDHKPGGGDRQTHHGKRRRMDAHVIEAHLGGPPPSGSRGARGDGRRRGH